MKWFFWPKTVSRLINEAVLEVLEGGAEARARQRERLDRALAENTSLRERNRKLVSTLDSTDPFTVSRRAAETMNVESSELVGALLEKQRLVQRGLVVPPELDAIIARGSERWSS